MPREQWNQAFQQLSNRRADLGQVAQLKLPKIVEDYLAVEANRTALSAARYQPAVDSRIQAYIDAAYRAKMIAKWRELGGVKSPLGLPTTFFPGGQSLAECRGGTITLQSLGDDPTVEITRRAQLKLVGIECFQYQEDGSPLWPAGDEVRATVTVVNPSDAQIEVTQLPRHDFSDLQTQTELRILYSGAPCVLTVAGTLVEEDSGESADETMKYLREGCEYGLKQLPFYGVAAETLSIADVVAKELGAQDDKWKAKVADEVWGFIGDIFGLGDDPYPASLLTIGGDEVLNPPPLRKSDHDPKVDFNYELGFHGKDHGGDWGTYRLLFQYTVEPA